MKRELYIFNPESDLALAFGSECYTAPPHARRLRRDLQMLPVWYCGSGAAVVSQDCAADAAWIAQLRHEFGIDVECVDINHVQNYKFRYCPWGWNHDLRHWLIRWCVPTEDLPAREWIESLRALSHRRTAILLHRHLSRELSYPLPPEPIEALTLAEVLEFEREHPQCYIKAPWSGSGRGIYQALDTGSPNFVEWTGGIIRRQGSVMCEQALERVMDFALEYRCESGTAEFGGYSVFTTDSHDSFDSCMVASPDVLRDVIVDRLGDAALLDAVIASCRRFVADAIAPVYSGWLGIDMMLYRSEDSSLRLNPCVEINLRMTMGVVAIHLADRYLASESIGTFRIAYNKSGVKEPRAVSRVELDRGKIVSGTMPLVPVYATSHYRADLTVWEKSDKAAGL